ncbi:glycosyltransferase family 2 protein [Marinoscillum sp.]|uniref:glycosyltransferase family 2 protein n=1 Tax=Marinoscillum sp. TaxID=2024838 RepID=UPI003BAC33AC
MSDRMRMKVKATVILPTTKERAPVLPYSIGSILQQTEKEIEIFVIGDGVDEATRLVIQGLMLEDDRIRFFDHPKGDRRGETYRHQALSEEARGEIVCYLLDRDLMLPNHIELMYAHLQEHNFCIHTSLSVLENHDIEFARKPFFGYYSHADGPSLATKGYYLFSQVGHTLEFYKELPYGWRVTPSSFPTDIYMWQQFMAHRSLNLTSTQDPTILYFKRGDHPGWSAERRAKDLAKFYPLMTSDNAVQDFQRLATLNLLKERERLASETIIIRGKTLSHLPGRIIQKLKTLFVKRW